MATLARVSWDPAFVGTPRVESTHSATHAATHTAVACTPGVESTLSSPALAALGTHATQSDGDASSRAASSCASLFVPPRWAHSASLHDPMPLRCGGTTHCNTLQHTATHCNTLQHTATHCNTLHTRWYMSTYIPHHIHAHVYRYVLPYILAHTCIYPGMLAHTCIHPCVLICI